MKSTEFLMDSPVFICGHPKSGTTLLLTLLDSHPELVVYPAETVFFRALLPRLNNLDYGEKLNLAKRFLLHYFETPSVIEEEEGLASKDGIDYNNYLKMIWEMDRILPDGEVRHEGDYLGAAILAFGKVHNQISPNTRYWVEKTPFNEQFTEHIYRWWPNARCIHVVRDPRDNFATYRRKHPNLTLERFCLVWNSSLRKGIANQKKYGCERYLLVKYENLVAHSEETLQMIIAFLGIQDVPILREPTKIGRKWSGNSMFKNRFNGISTAPIGRWRTELNPVEIRTIQTLCRKGMQQLEYSDLSQVSVSALWRLIRFYLLLTWRLPYRIYYTIKKHYELMLFS